MLTKIWRGDMPLATMFWVFFLIIPAILRVILLVSGFVTIADNENSAGHSILVIGLLGALMLAYYIFVFIGTWRSATAYSKERGGFFGKSGLDWGVIAKVAMILLFLGSGLTVL